MRLKRPRRRADPREMGNVLTRPIHGIFFLILMGGWLTCDHFGWDEKILGDMGSPESEARAQQAYEERYGIR